MADDDDRESRSDRFNRVLTGLWEGVDVLDGSSMKLSIVDVDGDRTLEFRFTETFFSSCFDPTDNPDGRGVYTGDVVKISRKEFSLDGTVECFNASGTLTTPLVLGVKYLRKTDILKVGSTIENFLHRTSNR